MVIDRHTLAVVSIIGSSLDVLGAMYLAYDLLGGEHGPLRILTRAVTYGAMFGAGYGIALGPVFGLSSGAAHGISLAWELARASRGEIRSGFWRECAVSTIRGLGFALGAASLFGMRFGITFGVFSTVGQVIAYRLGVSPAANYKSGTRPRVTRFQLWAGANRTAGYAVSGYISSIVAHRDHAVAVGLKAGLTVGLVTVIAGAFVPFVEYVADHIPEKRMGVYGVGMILIGFALQSIQYWLTLLDVSVA